MFPVSSVVLFYLAGLLLLLIDNPDSRKPGPGSRD